MITFEDIRQRPLSHTSLKEFRRSPMHFMHYRKSKPKDSPAYLLGNLADVLILTPDLFDKRFCMIPIDAPRRPSSAQINAKKPSEDTVKAIEWWNVFNKENDGKKVIDQELLDTANRMRDAVLNNDRAALLLGKAPKRQMRFCWEEKESGLPIVSIPDAIGDVIVSLKTAADADPAEFLRMAYTYEYHVQSAIETEALNRRGEFPDLYYIVVEKEEPFGVSILRATDDFKALGKKIYKHTMLDFKRCLDNNRFNEGYEYKDKGIGYHHLDLPPWAIKQLNE